MKKLKIIRVLVRRVKNHRILSIIQVFLLAYLLLLGAENALSQETEPDSVTVAGHVTVETIEETVEFTFKAKNFYLEYNRRASADEPFKTPLVPKNPEKPFWETPVRDFRPTRETESQPDAEVLDERDAEDDDAQTESKEKFHWKPALIQSGIFLGIQHGARLTQIKTRRQLPGPFFGDWFKSVKGLRGWRDGDTHFINYVAHPLQGGLTGRIYVNNSDVAKQEEFGNSKRYWQTRLKAMAWSAFWSTQFELGPISEASIGNVGLYPREDYSQMSYKDLVVTPTLGTAVVVGEDAIDKYILKNWIERDSRKVTYFIKFMRSILTPTTSFANILRGKPPWKRDDRK